MLMKKERIMRSRTADTYPMESLNRRVLRKTKFMLQISQSKTSDARPRLHSPMRYEYIIHTDLDAIPKRSVRDACSRQSLPALTYSTPCPMRTAKRKRLVDYILTAQQKEEEVKDT